MNSPFEKRLATNKLDMSAVHVKIPCGSSSAVDTSQKCTNDILRHFICMYLRAVCLFTCTIIYSSFFFCLRDAREYCSSCIFSDRTDSSSPR